MNRRTFLGAVPGAALTLRSLRSRRADLVLRGGTVYDGSGGPPVRADVAVSGDRISAVGPNLDTAGAAVIDCDGLAVSPGFIDIHSHTDLSLFVNPNAESKIRQGVTTEVAGQDGSSIGPWSESEAAARRERYRERYDVDLNVADLGGFFVQIERSPGSVNLASMVGAGTVRGTVIGEDDRPATPEELARMTGLVTRALEAGACGVSSGLEYVPGAFADLEELVALARPLAAYGLPYASHMRNEEDGLLGAIEEALTIGRVAGVPVHLSHIKAQGRRNWWKGEAALDVIDRAHADGVDVTFDRYPYVAYSTGLSNLFPVWSRDGGTDAFLARLDDPDVHPRIERAVRDKIARLGAWDAVQITAVSDPSLAWTEGGRLGTLAADRSVEPYVLLLDLIRTDRARTSMVGFGMSEANTARFLAHPLGMVCSDGGARAPYGPLSEGTPHPRTYGSFPRVLGHYVRDEGIMPLETAIYKMTRQPAERLRFIDRGRIEAGACADLVAFDPARVADTATFAEPHQYPVGIPTVVVNGTVVIRDGEHTGATPGRVVRPHRN